MIITDEFVEMEEDIKNFLEESTDWELEKILAMTLAYQMATYSLMTEQNKTLIDILEAIRNK